MARLLIERETIYQDEVDMIMDGKTAIEIAKAMEEKDGVAKENPFIKMEMAMNDGANAEKNSEDAKDSGSEEAKEEKTEN